MRDTNGGDGKAVARLPRSNDGAISDLFRSNRRQAFALALRILGEAEAAEDAVQDAFADVWKRVDRIRARTGRVESLLMTIVHRRAVDILRRRHHETPPIHDTEVLERVDEQAAERFEQVVNDVSLAGLRANLRDRLNALPAEQREAIELAYYHGLSQREIAERVDIPLGTVKSRVRLGMASLAESLRKGTGR